MSKPTYERLRAFCEVNQQSMSQFVEERIGDFLGRKAGGEKSLAKATSAAQPGAEKAKADQDDAPAKPAKKLTGDHIFTF